MKIKLTFFLCFLCIYLSAQEPIKWNVSMERAGELEVMLHFDAIIEENWHLYTTQEFEDGPLPTEINIKGDIISEIGKVIEPEPIKEYDPGFDVTSFYHKGNTLFSSQVLLKDDLAPGNYKIFVMTYYQVCNERLCYPPVEKNNVFKVKVEPGDPRIEKTTLTFLKKNHNGENGLSSFLNLIVIAIGGAILSWVMPCVYPMIPIIISFFGKVSEDKNIGRSSVAALYGLGIAGTFIFIGLLVSFLSWGVEDAAVQTGYANIAVSYTHLTLPTNREV